MRPGDRLVGPPWAGWVVLRARPLVRTVGILPSGRVGAVWVHGPGPLQYVCLLQDPEFPSCRANGIVLTDAQVRAPRPRPARL